MEQFLRMLSDLPVAFYFIGLAIVVPLAYFGVQYIGRRLVHEIQEVEEDWSQDAEPVDGICSCKEHTNDKC